MGEYEFRAVDEKNRNASASLVITADTSGQEQQGQRSEEDILLAPMPTLVPGAPTRHLSSIPAPQPVPVEEDGFPDIWLAVGAGVIIVSLLLLKLKK